MRDIPFVDILTPDRVSDDPPLTTTNTKTNKSSSIPFPTKSTPSLFYQSILQKHNNNVNNKNKDNRNIMFFDDSKFNIEKAEQDCDGIIKGIPIDHQSTTLENAILQAMGCLDPNFTFSDVAYLKHKNMVDEDAINGNVWKQLAQQLMSSLSNNNYNNNNEHDKSLRIVDVGAGLLSMLRLILEGSQNSKSGQSNYKPPLLDLIQQIQNDNDDNDNNPPIQINEIVYTA